MLLFALIVQNSFFSMGNQKRQQEIITPQQSKKTRRSCTTIENEDQEDSSLEDSRFPCKYCDKPLKTANSLNSHIHEHHTMEAIINLGGCVIVLRRKEDLLYHCPASFVSSNHKTLRIVFDHSDRMNAIIIVLPNSAWHRRFSWYFFNHSSLLTVAVNHFSSTIGFNLINE